MISIFPDRPFSQVLVINPILLAEKHKSIGIACNDCHKIRSGKRDGAMIQCNRCHGNQAKLAERTKRIIPNPHQSHLEDIKCELCHHGHRPSEDYCSHCHNFDFKVP